MKMKQNLKVAVSRDCDFVLASTACMLGSFESLCTQQHFQKELKPRGLQDGWAGKSTGSTRLAGVSFSPATHMTAEREMDSTVSLTFTHAWRHACTDPVH